VPPLAGKDLEILSKQLPYWKVVEAHHIMGTYTFPDFKQALTFVNRVGDVARSRDIIRIFCWGWEKAEVTTWTDKIDGLTDSQQAGE
jgi:Pterin-4a-carbinolamine dehydratase